MKAVASADTPDDLFFRLFDRYVQQVESSYSLPERFAREVVDKIDVSTLSADDQQGFEDWLYDRTYTQMSVANALRRNFTVKALVVDKTDDGEAVFSVQINR